MEAQPESDSGNPVYNWMEKLERRQDSFEATQQVTIDQINFMQMDLRSSRKAMHELLAIVKQTAAKRRVSYAREIGLISESVEIGLISELVTRKKNALERPAYLSASQNPRDKVCCMLSDC